MSALKKAVITGLGPVTSIGIGVNNFWESLCNKKSSISLATKIDTSVTRAKCTAEIKNFNLNKIAPNLPEKLVERTDLHTKMALASCELALSDANLEMSPDNPSPRAGVSFGSALGGISDAEDEYDIYTRSGAKQTDPSLALQIFGGAAHSNVAIAYGLQGPTNTASNSCASGNVAILEALRWIQHGYADVVIAGASEAPIAPLTYHAFDRIGAMSRYDDAPHKLACRPFDLKRDGFVMGEGAGTLVIESLEHAKKRGARIYAEILGGSIVNEAYHMTSPRPQGEPVIRAMQLALGDAKTKPEQIDFISPHASSTQLNDLNEANAISTLFGKSKKIPVTALKAYLGHSLGAASALEAISTVLSMQHQWVPPCIHINEPIQNSSIDFQENSDGKESDIQYALSNAFGFGGTNSSIVFKR